MRVGIRAPLLSDEHEFLKKVDGSRKFHRPWVHPPGTRAAFRAYLQRIKHPSNDGFVIYECSTNALVGIVNLNEIVYGSFRSAYLGYYVFADYAQKGLMSEGLSLVIRFAFRGLKLHRLEANIQPENHLSIALVRRLGFLREGFSPGYLKIGGRWRDHERWALLANRWKMPPNP